MVPMKSNTPIAASTPAAPTGATPKSPHSEIQCVWIRPLVLRPQTKKVREQDPEGAVARGLAQSRERREQQRRQPVQLRRRRCQLLLAVRRQPDDPPAGRA